MFVEVIHIHRASNPTVQDTAEVEGIYRAQVPIEPYEGPGNFYVHFFPGKRVRIVVSETTPSGELHPIRWDDSQASNNATVGYRVEGIFTDEEIAENQREVDRDRKQHGGGDDARRCSCIADQNFACVENKVSDAAI